MNVSLTPELEKFVARKVASGMYQTASEVMREGLRLLEHRDRTDREKFEDLRREIQIGVDQLDRGEGAPWNGEEIKAAVRRRLAQSRERGRHAAH